VLGQFTGQKQPHGGLDLSGGDGLSLVVVSKSRGLSGDPLKDVVHKGVHDGHGLGADTSVGVDLLEDLVDVDGVGFLPLLLSLLVSSDTAGLLACLLLGFLSRNRGHLQVELGTAADSELLSPPKILRYLYSSRDES